MSTIGKKRKIEETDICPDGDTPSKQQKIMNTNTQQNKNQSKPQNDEKKINDSSSCKYVINKNGSITFYPTPRQECEPSKKVLKQIQWSKSNELTKLLKEIKCNKLEKVNDPNNNIVIQTGDSTICSFITAALRAWSDHFPFKFKINALDTASDVITTIRNHTTKIMKRGILIINGCTIENEARVIDYGVKPGSTVIYYERLIPS